MYLNTYIICVAHETNEICAWYNAHELSALLIINFATILKEIFQVGSAVFYLYFIGQGIENKEIKHSEISNYFFSFSNLIAVHLCTTHRNIVKLYHQN